VQIETPVGVANAYDIAMVPGVDVLLGSNGDMANFSGEAMRSMRTSRHSTGARITSCTYR
jgi:2-keto-3-deoxy-L-rhamnonate aldolase RhmA